jgi:hypothetical protein
MVLPPILTQSFANIVTYQYTGSKAWQKNKIMTEVTAMYSLVNETNTVKLQGNQFLSSYIKELHSHTAKSVGTSKTKAKNVSAVVMK